jgi:hypothetical protein
MPRRVRSPAARRGPRPPDRRCARPLRHTAHERPARPGPLPVARPTTAHDRSNSRPGYASRLTAATRGLTLLTVVNLATIILARVFGSAVWGRSVGRGAPATWTRHGPAPAEQKKGRDVASNLHEWREPAWFTTGGIVEERDHRGCAAISVRIARRARGRRRPGPQRQREAGRRKSSRSDGGAPSGQEDPAVPPTSHARRRTHEETRAATASAKAAATTGHVPRTRSVNFDPRPKPASAMLLTTSGWRRQRAAILSATLVRTSRATAGD